MPDTESSTLVKSGAEMKRLARVFNERLKLGVGYIHAIALAVLGFGLLRFVFDPGGDPIGWGRLVSIILLSFAFEGVAIYLMRYLRSEDS